MERSPGFLESVTSLKRKLTKYVDTLEWISQLASTTRSFEFPDFFEPKTWLIKEKDAPARFQITGDLLEAWIGHLSHSSRRRMELYEDAVLDALSNDRFLIGATLTRSHMEASAWVAYGLEELTKAADNSNWSKLETLLPKMLNGSAITKDTKYIPGASVDPLWVEPSSIMNAIDALDVYSWHCSGHKSHDARMMYAILSDYAHPSIFSARDFFQAAEQGEAGWTISYGSTPIPTEDHCGMVLRALLFSMRLGHSAAIMLRLGGIEEIGGKTFYLKPLLDDVASVWQHIINGSPQSRKT